MPCSAASSRAAGAAGTSCGHSVERRCAACLAASRRPSSALRWVSSARDRVERPVLELGRLHGAAAHELLDGGAERPAAAAGHVSALGGAAAAAQLLLAIAIAAAILAGAPPLVIARAPAIVPVAITIPPAVWIFGAALRAISPAIVAACLVAILTLFVVLPLPLAGAPLVERAGGRALAIAVIAVMAAPRVGARGHAHHQHRRKQHPRCPHEWPPRWTLRWNNARGGAGVSPGVVPSPACSRSRKHPTSAGGSGRGHATRFAHVRSPLPNPLPQAGEGADRACRANCAFGGSGRGGASISVPPKNLTPGLNGGT
jgi:hypothetical protein